MSGARSPPGPGRTSSEGKRSREGGLPSLAVDINMGLMLSHTDPRHAMPVISFCSYYFIPGVYPWNARALIPRAGVESECSHSTTVPPTPPEP